MRRPTLSELVWPNDEESRRQAARWAASATVRVLDWTWRGFDALRRNVLQSLDMSQHLDQLERDLTSKHFVEIQRIFAEETEGLSSIIPHHEFPESESRPGGSGRPPASDISFVWYDNQRVSWPLEAKVLPTPGTLAEYLGDTEKFTDGIAAPLVGEGAQLAYLLSGTTDDFFRNLRPRLASPLRTLRGFSGRAHRVSFHARGGTPDLRLHHMAMRC